MTSFPSFPQIGEGELRVRMKQETINSNYKIRLALLWEPHKWVMLRAETQEELDALVLSAMDRAFKGEL